MPGNDGGPGEQGMQGNAGLPGTQGAPGPKGDTVGKYSIPRKHIKVDLY